LAAGDSSTPDFFDLFNHRLISLFYRAWNKYRVARTNDDHESGSFTRALYSLIGLEGPALRGRLPFADAALLYRANLFSPRRRTAEGLTTLLVDTLRLPIVVEQMVGRWVVIEPAERSRLGTLTGRRTLGEGLVLGRRIFEEQSKFRLHVGPLTFAEFRRLLPAEPLFRSLVALTRLYVGPEFEFDLSLILKADEVPKCTLRAGTSSSQLGRFSWVRSRGPLEDCTAVFRAETYEQA
jgi:type VI secretion system protein ImpH